MGNADGIFSNKGGRNQVCDLGEWGYFSFAHGDEIALVVETKEGMFGRSYFILNCDSKLWDDVQKFSSECNNDKNKIIDYWVEKSKDHEISDWSSQFEKLIQQKED